MSHLKCKTSLSSRHVPTMLFVVCSGSELFVDTPEVGTADRISVHLDVTVTDIACQCMNAPAR